ncbi:hypothetical protein FKZ61_000800 [Litorilinea aerophila]|uniref:Blue (type 1) copper domain-containing protein n=1 Tax=Litorilinea aerophila TaxID=1204385 RepID=A0A540VMF2_9CHLR|nr:hypothetical protein [Litorilinea aerophila]MCC9074653.1 hypothetical protein [Litorilinea aerophila]OUC06214.1 hypothetical protein RY27_22430 [Litorilinea aerophila]GIV75834.1 MAG: hypothetical protein KatS3mg050_0228 [Litorilinea sp.]
MQIKYQPTWQMVTPFLFVLVGFVLAACQTLPPPSAPAAAAPAIPEARIEINADGIVVPADFPGGIVSVTVKNNDSQDLDVGFERLREGVTEADAAPLLEDVTTNFDALGQMLSDMGSFNPLPAGGEQDLVMDFRTGRFLIYATEHSDGPPIPGASYRFGSFAAKELVGTVEPQADVVVGLHDFAYAMPDEIKAGEQLWEFKNEGDQFHMMILVKPNPGVTLDELKTAFAAMESGELNGPPPFEFVENGGLAPISEGERVWVKASLEPGEYVAACPLPDMEAIAAGGPPLPHYEHGMIRMFTVKE